MVLSLGNVVEVAQTRLIRTLDEYWCIVLRTIVDIEEGVIQVITSDNKYNKLSQ